MSGGNSVSWSAYASQRTEKKWNFVALPPPLLGNLFVNRIAIVKDTYRTVRLARQKFEWLDPKNRFTAATNAPRYSRPANYMAFPYFVTSLLPSYFSRDSRNGGRASKTAVTFFFLYHRDSYRHFCWIKAREFLFFFGSCNRLFQILENFISPVMQKEELSFPYSKNISFLWKSLHCDY